MALGPSPSILVFRLLLRRLKNFPVNSVYFLLMSYAQYVSIRVDKRGWQPMTDHVASDILVLAIPTLWVAFLWRYFRLKEINELAGERTMRWRWIEIGLLMPVYAFYVVTFDNTPLLIRISIALTELIAFSVWIYYCDNKMGK
jgi:hypothetical protein